MPTSNNKFDFVPPEWELTESGSMKFAKPFSLGRYKEKWTDAEREAVKLGGVEAFSSIVERDRREFQKMQDGVDPLEDQALFDWTLDRGIEPDKEGGVVWKIIKDLFTAGADIAYNKMSAKHAVDLIKDPKKTIMDDLGTLAGGAVNMTGELFGLINGGSNLIKKALPETDAQSRQRKREFLLASRNLGRDQDKLYDDIVNVTGMDKDTLEKRSELIGELLDPVELPVMGRYVFGGKLMPGALEGLGREARDLAAEIGRKVDAGEVVSKAEIRTANAAGAKYADALDQMKVLSAQPGALRRGTGAAAVGAGKGLEWLGRKAEDIGEAVARKVEDPVLSGVVSRAAGTAVGGAAGAVLGGPAGAIVGGVVGGAGLTRGLVHTGRDLAALGRLWRVGQTTQPLLRNLRQEAAVSGVTKAVAGLLDPMVNVLSPALGAAGRVAGATAKGAAISGAFGYVFGGGESMDSVIQGAAAGIPFGVVGGIAQMWHPVYSQAQEEALRANQRQLVEDRFVPGTPSRNAWDQLGFEAQTSIATYLHAHPDVDLQLTDQGAGWASVINGRGTIAVNPRSANPMQMIVAHELGHNAISRGLKPAILRELIGNVAEGRPGQYTLIGKDGKPVVSEILNKDNQKVYETTQEFKDLKDEYEKKLTKSPGYTGNSKLSDADAAFEIAAELNAEYMLSGDFEKAINPASKFGAAGLFTAVTESNPMRTLLGKFGVTFNEDGPISTPIYKKLRTNKNVRKIFDDFYKAQSRSKDGIGPTDTDAGVQFTRKEIRENPEIISNFLNSDQLNIDPQTGLPHGVVRIDGKLMVQDESKMYRSPRAIRESRESFAASLRTAIDASEETTDESVQSRVTEDGREIYAGKYITDDVLDLIEAEGIHNPNQIGALREINQLLRNGEGDSLLFFYQPAENRPIGNRKRVKGAFAGHWRNEIPYGIQISQKGNIHIMMVSPDVLVSNMTRAWIKNKANVRDTWTSDKEMIGDMQKYLDNVSNSRLGGEGIGELKMKKLNAMMGIKGAERSQANPYYNLLNATSASWLANRRLDRINKGSPVSKNPLPWGVNQNEQVKGAYMPGAVVDDSIIIPDSEAPKKTKKAYKLFVLKDGELYPLFAAKDEGGDYSPVTVGKWLRAENRRSKKQWRGGKRMAPRPGWHSADLPFTTHLLQEDGTLAEDRVWAEVEIGDDVDWQSEADSRGRVGTKGQWIDGQIKDQIPVGGNYYFKTNPNMTGKWLISGEIKVNRILTREEAARIVDKAQMGSEPVAPSLYLPNYGRKGGFKRLPASFIRFGLPPEGGKSGIHTKGKVVGREKGVSTYLAWRDPKTKMFVIPRVGTEDQPGVGDMADGRKAYLMGGKVLPDVGSDEEALLAPGTAKVIREIPFSQIVEAEVGDISLDGVDLPPNKIPDWQDAKEVPLQKRTYMPETAEFKQWFGKGALKTQSGFPRTLYHGSKNDVETLKPKYADGLVFLTTNPKFAADWIKGSGGLRDRAVGEKRSPEVEAQLKAEQDAYMANIDWDYINAEIEKGNFEPADEAFANEPRKTRHVSDDELYSAVYPVWTNVEKPFDPREDWAVVEPFFNSLGADYRELVKKGHHKYGNWIMYENPATVEFLKSKGYDALWLAEDGTAKGLDAPHETLAVMGGESKIKSAIGNNGNYSTTDSRMSYMPETVRHWSNVKGLTEVDPKYHGTGLNGAERQRKKDYPELYVNRSYFGRKTYKPEPGLGKYKYKATLKNSSLYDFGVDPLDIYTEAHERVVDSDDYAPMDEVAKITMMEKIIKDRGYSGYVTDDVVALFETVPVKSFMPDAAASEAAKPEDFLKTPSMVKALKSPGWIAMEGTPQGKTHSSKEGKAGTKKLRDWLQKSEYQFMEVEGRYREESGKVQSGPSFLVFGVPEDSIPALAKQFNQESIAYYKGLIYQDGKIVPSRKVLTGKHAAATDYHTHIPLDRFPKTFSLELDFDSAYNPTTGVMQVGDKTVNTKGFTERQYEILAKAGSNIRAVAEDPSAAPLEIQTDEAGNPKFKTNAETGEYNGIEYVKKPYDMWNTPNALAAAEGLTDKAEREAAIVRMYADGLKRRIDDWKNIPEIMAGHGWYSRMRVKLKNTFKEDTEIFTQMLGALSAQTAVDQNFLYALEAYEAYKAGKWDTNVEKFREGLALLESGELERITNTKTPAKALEAWVDQHDLKPKKKNGKLFGANSSHLLRVLNGDWLQNVKGPKTPNFQGNLTGRTLEATIDLWAARTIRSIGWEGTPGGRIVPQAEVGVTDVDFFLAQKAFRLAADELGMNPDDLQAVVWFGEKHVWDENQWTKNAGAEKSSFDDMYHVFFDAETGEKLDSKTAAANLKALKAK